MTLEQRWIEPSEIKNITVLQGTQHGKLSGISVFEYTPEPGFYGDDLAIFMAEYAGKHYKIVVQIKVTENFNENDPQCSEPQLIKINGKPVSGSLDYAPATDSGTNLDTISVTFADLPDGAVGQTVGNTGGTTDETTSHLTNPSKDAE